MAQGLKDSSAGSGRDAGGWRKWLLVVSLGLNLMVVGLVAGAMLRGGPDGRPSRLDLTVGPLTRAMAPEDRDALRARLREEGAFNTRDRRAIRDDMQALLAVLRADAFDSTTFRAVVLRQRARLDAGQDSVLNAVALQIEGMSLAQRAEFADRLEDQMRRDSPRAPENSSRGGSGG